MIENITPVQLEELAVAGKPVAIDFYATWCGPCKMFAPIFERTAAALADTAVFVKMDVDLVPDIARSFGIQHVPTLIVLKDGKELHRSSGVMTEPALTKLLKELA